MTPIATPSPNYDSREGAPIDMLVLHYTGMQSGEAARARLCDPAAKVSAHYVVEEDGRVFQLVDEAQRAWHAGVSSWRGHHNINARSIGIEIVNPGHEWGYRPFPEAQMQAVQSLCNDILSRHDIPARNVVAHSDIAPERKQDPGELFDWKRLAAAGVGLWPEESSESRIQSSEGQGVMQKLTAYGYGEGDERATVTAFQRHFRPERVDGIWDEPCARLLDSLLKQVYSTRSRGSDGCGIA